MGVTPVASTEVGYSFWNAGERREREWEHTGGERTGVTRGGGTRQDGRMLAPLDEILGSLRVVTLPLAVRFRGVDHREVALFRGPSGWAEFSPFVEYRDAEASAWLAAAMDFAFAEQPEPVRGSVRVNATVPAVAAARVPEVLDRFGRCRTAKVKVAEPGETLDDDVARVAAVRSALGPEGRVRIDANGAWNLDEAERAIHALAEFDLEYVEQPCIELGELVELRRRIRYLDIPIAADESIRKAADPGAVARVGAADILVIKAQPLRGIRSALSIVADAGLPAVVSSALESSVGLSMGVALAAALPELDYDCGLGTGALLAADVTANPVQPTGGELAVRRVAPDPAELDAYATPPDRASWWRDRVRRCHALLAARERD